MSRMLIVAGLSFLFVIPVTLADNGDKPKRAKKTSKIKTLRSEVQRLESLIEEKDAEIKMLREAAVSRRARWRYGRSLFRAMNKPHCDWGGKIVGRFDTADGVTLHVYSNYGGVEVTVTAQLLRGQNVGDLTIGRKVAVRGVLISMKYGRGWINGVDAVVKNALSVKLSEAVLVTLAQ